MIDRLSDAFSRAVTQLPERGLRFPLLVTLVWTTLAFAVIWGWAIHRYYQLEDGLGGYRSMVAIGGLIVLAIGSWFAFAIVENTILFCYADRIVDAVERRHYPALGRAAGSSWGDSIRSALRLLFLTVVGNLLALPFYVFVPGMNLVLFLALNGYLLGRGYFDVVALRRMDDRTARLVWRADQVPFIINGAVVALLLTVPLVNLVVPIVGLAATVHLLEQRRGVA
jgi:uncharacterized protein involved in cysteine biosynthesis